MSSVHQLIPITRHSPSWLPISTKHTLAFWISQRMKLIQWSQSTWRNPIHHFKLSETVFEYSQTSSDSPGMNHKKKAGKFDTGVCLLSTPAPLKFEVDTPPWFPLKQLKLLYIQNLSWRRYQAPKKPKNTRHKPDIKNTRKWLNTDPVPKSTKTITMRIDLKIQSCTL